MSAAWMNFTKIPLFHDEGAMSTGMVRCRMRGAAAGREPDRRRVRHRDAARVRPDVPPVASGSGWYLKVGDTHSRGLTPPTTASRCGPGKPATRNTVHAMRRATARTARPSDAGGGQLAQAAAVRWCRLSSRCRSDMIACIGLRGHDDGPAIESPAI